MYNRVVVVDSAVREMVDEIADIVRNFEGEDLYTHLALFLAQHGYIANKVKKKLWEPQKWNPEWASKILGIVRKAVAKRKLTVASTFITGSMAYSGKGHDIDVVVVVREHVKPKVLEEIEVDIKAEWDAWASEHNLPPLDPIVFSGYMPFNGVVGK